MLYTSNQSTIFIQQPLLQSTAAIQIQQLLLQLPSKHSMAVASSRSPRKFVLVKWLKPEQDCGLKTLVPGSWVKCPAHLLTPEVILFCNAKCAWIKNNGPTFRSVILKFSGKCNSFNVRL